MSTTPLQDTPPFAGYDDDEHHPLGGYGALMAVWGAAMAGFLAWKGDELPDQGLGARDLILTTVAGHKLSRLIGSDRVTSTIRAPFTEYQERAGHGEVEETARGRGLRKAVGDLIICAYCLGLWSTGAIGAGMVAAPRTTRFLAGVLAAHAGADALQVGYSAAEKASGSLRPG